ncbi:hypothetical protein G7009_08660 [Pseudomonas capeferrum]|uniref:hypothetical protein n=1 Tax=Pseudomonas capeferrum TaxID=1495066 RepID=UPI0015E35B63|nr:hypothetical protein [Pseudomonas capeferrum]MBA1201831.1 hypothetical protein [Pseudomonas capeferrum]
MITTAEYPSAVTDGSNRSGVSWAAIFAGAAGAAALSLILVILGAGLGFAATSPWANEGASAKALGITTIIWLLVTQILASGLGGYIAGRLRVKWANLHGDEVYFRDTAHGFLAWAVATLVAFTLIISTAGNVVSAGAQAGASMASGVVTAAGAAAGGAAANSDGTSDPMGYFVDSLFRTDGPSSVSEDAANGVASRIFTKAMAGDGTLNADDRTYLAQLVAQRTRLTQAEAEARVDQVYAQVQKTAQDAKVAAQEAADAAASAAAWTALWTFVALLCGAFFASLAAIFGGRQRDQARWIDVDGADYGDRHVTRTTTAPLR